MQCGKRKIPGASGIMGMSVNEMKILLEQNELPTKGTRTDLCQMILSNGLVATQHESTQGLESLPNDIILQMAMTYSYDAIMNMCVSNKKFYQIICNNNKFWKNKTIKDFKEKLKNLDVWVNINYNVWDYLYDEYQNNWRFIYRDLVFKEKLYNYIFSNFTKANFNFLIKNSQYAQYGNLSYIYNIHFHSSMPLTFDKFKRDQWRRIVYIPKHMIPTYEKLLSLLDNNLKIVVVDFIIPKGARSADREGKMLIDDDGNPFFYAGQGQFQ